MKTCGWTVGAAVLALLLAVNSPQASAADVAVKPVGEYAQIDTRLTIEAIEHLGKGSANEKEEAIRQIKAGPDKYAPPAFYALSYVLLQRGDKDDAAFWFYAGQLRARFDANRCADVSAREAVAVLNQQFGPPINEY